MEEKQKSDKTQQKPTKNAATNKEEVNRLTGLTPRQSQVALLLSAGKSITEIAEEMQINRSTIYVWLEKFTFQCYLNKLNKELRDKTENELFSMQKEAIEVLRQSLKSENEAVKMKAAIWIVEKVEARNIGESSPANILKRRNTTNSIIDWDNNSIFDEKGFKAEMKKYGLAEIEDTLE